MWRTSVAQGIILKSVDEVAAMKEAGQIAAATMQILKEKVRPGIKTKDLDSVTAMELKKRNARSSFLGYRGFPSHLCVSINEEVVHGIPGERVLKEGDIVSLDVGAVYNGFQADMAITVGVGDISDLAARLLKATEGALKTGIGQAYSRRHLSDISAAVQAYVEKMGFSVVREYTGHGIGRDLHEEPQIPNFGFPGRGPVLMPGMTLALEPMVTAGGWRTRIRPNLWTVVTADGSLAAHFEHTIAVTQSEPMVLTEFA